MRLRRALAGAVVVAYVAALKISDFRAAREIGRMRSRLERDLIARSESNAR